MKREGRRGRKGKDGGKKVWGLTHRSSSWSNSRWSVSAAFRCSLSSASRRARAMSSTRAQNASVPSCKYVFVLKFFKNQENPCHGRVSTCRTNDNNNNQKKKENRTPFWNWDRSSRRRRSNSPDFLNLRLFWLDWVLYGLIPKVLVDS